MCIDQDVTFRTVHVLQLVVFIFTTKVTKDAGDSVHVVYMPYPGEGHGP